MEIMETSAGSSALVLANPISKGVSKVKQAPLGGLEQDVGGLTEGEG